MVSSNYRSHCSQHVAVFPGLFQAHIIVSDVQLHHWLNIHKSLTHFVGYFQILVNISAMSNPFVSAVDKIYLTNHKGGTHCICVCQKENTFMDTTGSRDIKILQIEISTIADSYDKFFTVH